MLRCLRVRAATALISHRDEHHLWMLLYCPATAAGRRHVSDTSTPCRSSVRANLSLVAAVQEDGRLDAGEVPRTTQPSKHPTTLIPHRQTTKRQSAKGHKSQGRQGGRPWPCTVIALRRGRCSFAPQDTPPSSLGVGMVRLQQARDKKLETRTAHAMPCSVDGIRFSRHGTRSSREKK